MSMENVRRVKRNMNISDFNLILSFNKNTFSFFFSLSFSWLLRFADLTYVGKNTISSILFDIKRDPIGYFVCVNNDDDDERRGTRKKKLEHHFKCG